jgi:hypothetical protein
MTLLLIVFLYSRQLDACSSVLFFGTLENKVVCSKSDDFVILSWTLMLNLHV